MIVVCAAAVAAVHHEVAGAVGAAVVRPGPGRKAQRLQEGQGALHLPGEKGAITCKDYLNLAFGGSDIDKMYM